MDLRNLPMLPGGHGLFGHIQELSSDRLAFLDKLAMLPGSVLRLRDLFVPVLVVNSPETVHELLVDRSREFDKSRMFRFALYPLAGEGLFTARENIWKGQRKLMAPLFHPRIVESFAADMVACVDRSLETFRDGEVREIAHDTTRLTMAVAGKTLFDADTFTDADEIGKALTVALEWTSNNAPSPLSVAHIMTQATLQRAALKAPTALANVINRALPKFDSPIINPGKSGRELNSAIAILDARVQRMIDQRRAATTQTDDLLSKLLSAKDDEQRGMSDKQVRDEILTLFVAGHETTAAGLAWTLHLLAKHPEIRAAAEAEADAIVGVPTAKDLPNLGLLGRIFKEALRLYPPVYMFSRQSVCASQLAGFSVPENTVVLISPYALHRRADLWPDPLRFDPSRFLPENEAKRSRYAWLPFGAGPRVCIGMQFALMEAQLVLARMLKRCRFEPTNDEVPEAYATLRPKHHMPMRVRFRN